VTGTKFHRVLRFEEDADSDLMSKQGEYIRYLEEQKHNLSKQILELTQELETANEHIQSTIQTMPTEEVQKRNTSVTFII